MKASSVGTKDSFVPTELAFKLSYVPNDKSLGYLHASLRDKLVHNTFQNTFPNHLSFEFVWRQDSKRGFLLFQISKFVNTNKRLIIFQFVFDQSAQIRFAETRQFSAVDEKARRLAHA